MWVREIELRCNFRMISYIKNNEKKKQNDFNKKLCGAKLVAKNAYGIWKVCCKYFSNARGDENL